MQYKRMKMNSYRVVPVIPLQQLSVPEKEKNTYKKTINMLGRMNATYLAKGAGQIVKNAEGKDVYRDVPNVSYQLYKMGDKIQQYAMLPQSDAIRPKLQQAIHEDGQSIKMVREGIDLPVDHLHTFAVKGLPQQYALDLDGEYHAKIKKLLQSTGQDQALYSLTVKEIEDHDKKRKELTKRLAGVNPDKKVSVNWHRFKRFSKGAAKSFHDFWYDEHPAIKEDHKKIARNLRQLLPNKKKQYPLTLRKLANNNRYMQVEILFMIWTQDQTKANQFRRSLQDLMTEMQGENQLEVVPVKPDLTRVQKGHLQYDRIHQLCLYQKELSKFLLLPSIDEVDDSFYVEHEQKTEIPAEALRFEMGGLALGRKMDTKEIIALPKATKEIDLDDRGTPTLISGKKGSGKTQLLINQVADTFCLGASDTAEWREKARSTIVFDVADGNMLRGIYELVPTHLKDRVIFLNHADLDNPLPITNHDILNIDKSDGFEEEIASLETEILMDSLKDKSNTVGVERHFKAALQASYLAGKGNIIDAMKIIEDSKYRKEIIQILDKSDSTVFLPDNLREMDEIFKEAKDLDVINNRISRVKNTQPWIDSLAQTPTEGLDFWKWINGDENGAYLVLIYIPKRINKSFRSFLFAHYLLKIWYMTEAREIINEEDRREFLVIVDELHQIFGHRVVSFVLEAISKEARKYRGRYVFTLHGWSSIKNKELKETIKDASGNYIMLKGGDDMFSDLKEEFDPYTVSDFNNLMKLSYTGLFKIDIKKQTQVFQASLMEPASVRFRKHRSLSLERFRSLQNQYGRPKKEVRDSMKKGAEKPCNKQKTSKTNQKPTREELDADLATITGESESQKVS